MKKYLILMALATMIAAGAGYADQPEKRIDIAVARTPANNGKLMYASYCSSCHGLNGKGNGPMAPELKRQPADLTALSKNNRGKFPLGHVKAVLQFGAASRSQGVDPMPVWGPILNQLDSGHAGQDMGMIRIISLCQYLESIQEK